MDLDWDHVRASDVFAVLRSFVPKGGALVRVTVYPSDYGLQRMAEEAVLGPRVRQSPGGGGGGGRAGGREDVLAGRKAGRQAGRREAGR